jgi:Na+/H+ antiporter NhaD/arsenite permease-like protein
VVVRAFDNAGNWRDSSNKIEVSEIQKTFYLTQKGLSFFNFFVSWLAIAVAILILILVIIFLSWFYNRSYKKLEEKRRSLNELIEKAQIDKKVLEEKLKENNKMSYPL